MNLPPRAQAARKNSECPTLSSVVHFSVRTRRPPLENAWEKSNGPQHIYTYIYTAGDLSTRSELSSGVTPDLIVGRLKRFLHYFPRQEMNAPDKCSGSTHTLNTSPSIPAFAFATPSAATPFSITLLSLKAYSRSLEVRNRFTLRTHEWHLLSNTTTSSFLRCALECAATQFDIICSQGEQY